MRKRILFTSTSLPVKFFLLVVFFISVGTMLHAQQNVFSRDNSGTGDWGSGNLPWFYQTSNNNQGDPDNNNTTRNDVFIGHNNNLTMTLNGRYYIHRDFTFQAGASSARTLNNSSGGGFSFSRSLINASIATHVFETPVGIDGNNAEFRLDNGSGGNLTFNGSVFTNNNQTFIRYNNGNTGTITFNGAMTQGGSFVKQGGGTLVFTGSADFSGSIFIDQGTVRINRAFSSNAIEVGGGVNASSGLNAVLEISSNVTVSKNITVKNFDNIGGNRTINFTHTTGTATLSGTLALEKLVTIDNGSGNSGATISGIISGTGALTKTGAGILLFSGANTYTGTTTVTAGTLRLGAADRISNSSNLVLNGGTFSSGASTGFSETMGTLNLNANSTIALGTGDHTLTFSASNGVTWNGTTLTITGWTGTAGQSGTAGKIRVGTNASGLLSGQLDKINFSGYPNGADILSTGEVVPRCGNPTNGGTIASSQTICFNGDPAAFTSSATASGQTGTLEYKWQYSSVSNFSSDVNDIASSNSTTYDPPSGLTATRYYRRLARVTCKTDWTGSAESNILTVTVRPAFTAGEISSTGQTICSGGTPSQIGSTTAASGGDGSITYSWRSSADGYTSAISGATSATYTPPNGLTTTTSYRRYANDGTCNTSPTVSTGTWTVTVTTTTTTIAPTAIQNIPVSTNGTTLTVTEGTNTVTSREWKYSTVSGGPYTTGTGVTGTAYTPNFGSTGTYYVVCETVYAGPCSVTITSNQVQINVTSNTITTGTISGSPFCVGATNVTVPFTYSPTSSFAGSTFTAQLSDASGSFASSTTLQNVSSDGSGSQSISVTIPSVSDGTGYRIRVVSNSPAVNGADNGTNLTIRNTPTAANAGPDQTSSATCGLTQVTLAANTPTVGTGSWSVVSGAGGSFGNSSSPTSTFNGTAGTTYTLRWTISNSPCTASTDDVVITFNQNPTASNAGPDQTSSATCGLTQVTLAANTPTAGTGSWSIVSGAGGSFGNSSSPTSTFNGTAGTTYTLRWTISNSPCTASTDDVVITFNQNPTASNAGPDQTSSATCGLTQVTLAANTPTVGTGGWSIVSGAGGSFGNSSSPTSTFSGTAGTTYTLRWTISNSPCTASTDDVVITFNQNPTASNAGPDQTSSATCGLTQVTLAANTPTVGTGSWSIVSGAGGSFGNSSSPTSTFSGTAGTTYTLRWTISNSPCTASTDDVVVTFNVNPTTANAGPDQTDAATCGLTQVTLAANTPSVGTGAWTVVTGTGGSFGNAASASSTFSGTAGTAYTLRWTTTNGVCTSTDDVAITFNQNPTAANAGPDQTGAATCGLTQVTLAGNTPTVGTGSWSIISGTGGSFGNASSPTSTFSGTAGTTYVLRWTISNSPCTASTDDVTVTFNRNPTTANAGPNQTGATTCGLTQVTLAANTPTVGTGSWSIVSGVGGSFGDAGSPSSTFSGTAGTTYVLRWTISNSPCTASTSDVTITFNRNPTTANAGSNQTICAGTVATLGANTPTIGTGAWTFQSGPNTNTSQLSSTSSPTATFTPTAAGTYVLRWTISNSPCTASTSDVTITVSGTATWVGGTSTNWHTAANWSCGSVPNASTDVVIPSGTTFSPDISTANANARSVAINSSATLSMSDNFTLTIAAAGAFTNNGTFTATAGTVSFADGGSVAGSNATTFNNLTINTGSLTLTTVPTINGIFQINGGSVNAGPRYGSSSTLRYNVSYNRFNEWSAAGVGTIGTTQGYPNNVEIATGTFSLRNGSDNPRALHGSLTINGSTTFSMENISASLTVRQNVTINGTMNLSTAGGGDVYVGGNWTVGASGAQNNNTRAVFFNAASGDQTVTRTGGGNVFFDYLILDKAAGNVVISSSPATDIEINTTSGDVLQLMNNGGLDLNGRILRFNNSGGNILVNGSNRSITSAVAGGRIDFNQFKTISNNGSGNLVIGANVTVNLNANGNVNFGSSLTTINGTLSINSSTSCFVNTNPPIYGSGSFLVYNSGGTYGRGLEWSATSGAGYPANVTVNGGTSVNMGANSGAGTARQMSGNLLVNGGFFMDFGTEDMTQPVTVLGNVTIAGTLSLSDAVGGDFVVGGNWINTGTFNPKLRLVTFNGTADQTITRSGGENFDFVTVNKSAGNLVLANNVTFNRTLTLTNGDVVTGSNRAIISSGGDITAGSNGSHINGNLQRHFATGSNVSRSYPIGDGTNLTTATITLGSVGTAGSIVLRTDAADHPNLATYGLSPTKYVRRYWTATNVSSVFTGGSIVFNYLAGDLQGGAVSSLLRPARYTGTAWTYPANYSTGTNQFTVTDVTNTTLEQSYTAGECQSAITFTPTNDGPLCEGSTLNLNVGAITGGTGPYTYLWSGPGSYSATTVPASRANVVLAHAGSYSLTVTDNVGCSGTANTTVVINAAPTVSNAGSNQTICISTGTATLNANNPTVGVGAWSVVSGPSTLLSQFADAAVRNTTFTPAGGAGVYTLRWTITNAPCTESVSNVVLTFDALPTSSNAGSDQTLCNTSTFTMAGNQPSVGTGVWSILSGPGTITNASLFNTTVTGVTAGSTTVLRWTISNGTCAASIDEVSVTNVAPPTTAAAGSDQEQCNNGSFTLAGNTPTTGTGAWTVVTGTATITTPSSPTSGVTGVPLGSSATLRWTITNGICTASTDDVVLTNSNPPDVASAGSDQAQCQNGSFTLAGNNPTNGTGTWTVQSGTATITTPSSFNTTVTGVPAGTTAVLRWTISSGTCPPTFDEVILTNSNPPTTANAGADQSGCSSGTVTLAGNTPSSGTGAWTVESGGSGTFGNANSATSSFSAAAGTYVLRWTISTPGCTASFDEVTITIVNSPTTAAAGPDQSKCDNGTFTMAANTPVFGTGSWSVVSGSATITNASSPTTTITLGVGTTATLRWTIASAPCDPSTDDVILTYNAANEWVGVTSSDWNVGSNWSCGTVPVSGASITIPSGTTFSPNIGISGPNASITSLTIENGATLTMSSAYVLTFANGGTFTNNGTFTAGDGTVVFSGSGTVAGSQASGFHHVTINGGVNFGSSLSTINGTLQINAGGFVQTNAPRYGASSTLRYNTGGTYGRNLEWSANGAGTIGTTAGYPNHVVLTNNTVLQMGANAGTGTTRALDGNLTIESGSTFTMSGGGAMTQPVTVRGNVVIDGTLQLSSAAGGDMNVQGNWTVGTSGNQTNNGRLVQFNSSTNAAQTITKNGGGTVFFDFLHINNTATNGKVLLSSSPATDLQINSTTNDAGLQQLQLTNGTLDLNGETLTMNGTVPNSTNIRVANGTRTITGPVGSSINFTGSATAGTQNLNVVPATGTDRLLFDDNVNVQTSVGVVFRNTTINSIFQINQNGFVAGSNLSTDPPVYGINSTLIYNNGTNGFNRNYEWTAASGTLGTTPGYPNNIIVTGTTTPVDIANPGVSSGVRELSVAGTLEIQAGSVVTMSAMNYPLTVNGTLHVDGTLTLSSNSAGNLQVGGDWIRGASGTFNQNDRVIRFIGSDNQSINKTGGETFSLMTVDKTGNIVSLASNLTITNTLTLDNGTFDVATHALVLNDLITATGGSLLSGETGTVIYNKITGTQDVIFAEYGNLTLNNAAAKTLANNLAVRGDFIVSGGTVTPGDDIRFSGNREQNIAGLLNYRNMAFSGTGNFTKRFTSDAAFTGAMTFPSGAGTVDVDGSGDNVNFTIVSTATATARVANVNGWSVSGRAIVERYIPSQRKWRLISIPATGETIRQSLTRQLNGSYPDPVCFGGTPQGVGSGTLLTGHSFSSCGVAVANGFDHVVTGGLSSIRFYNSAASNPWASATSTPNILAAPSHSAYLVFIRGDRNQLETGSSTTTLRPKGTLKQHTQNFNINAPFVAVGNPYASPIEFDRLYDFDNATGNKTRITRNFWIWDADLNTSAGGVGGYRAISADFENNQITSYTAVPALPNGTTIDDYLLINSGQGIIVQRRDAGGTVGVEESHKIASEGNILPFRQGRVTNTSVGLFHIDLYRATGTSPEIMMDGAVGRFGDHYSTASNEVYDVYKANQFEENISLVRNNNYLSIESRPFPTSADTLFVPFYFTTNRDYALKFKAANMVARNLVAVLQDKFTGMETPVPLDGSELVYPFAVNSTAASKALDRFRVVFRPGVVTPVVDLFAQKGISIYPNPVVKEETVQVHFRNSPAGRYELRLTNMLGVTVLQKVVVHSGGTAVQPLRLPSELAAGTYFVEMLDAKGTRGMMKLVVQ